jgi:putative membrane protein insertion efficiency factor
MSDHCTANPSAEIQATQSLAKKSALFSLRFYKTYLSMFAGGSCRFEPTCSIYAYQAVERFGVAHGSWLALKRLLRCQPLSRKFGYDPVPESRHPSAAVTPEEAHS